MNHFLLASLFTALCATNARAAEGQRDVVAEYQQWNQKAFFHSGDTTEYASFSPDGQHIAVAADDATVRVWDINTQQEIVQIPFDAAAWWAQYESRQLLTASQDHTASICDPRTGTKEITFEHKWEVNTISCNKEETIFLTGSAGVAYAWDKRTVKQLFSMECDPYGPAVYAVSFNPDETKIVAGGEFATMVPIFNAKTGQLIENLEPQDMTAYAVCWNHEGDKIATGTEILLSLWDVDTKKTTKTETSPGMIARLCLSKFRVYP